METVNTHYHKKPGSGKKWAGLILLLLGVILLVRSLGGFIPDWITSWPMLFIIIGISVGLRDNFRKPGAFVFIFIGGFFLAGEVIPRLDLSDFVFPVLIMGLGIYLILGRKKAGRFINPGGAPQDRFTWDKKVEPTTGTTEGEGPADPSTATPPPFQEPVSGGVSPEDYLDTVSIFGGIKKNIISKNFRGGDIVTIMGGAEINLTQADIHGTVIIDITQVFGGTKLIIPPQWKVSSDLAALFGGIEDKRPLMPMGSLTEGKVLILRGTSVFGGIDIRSF